MGGGRLLADPRTGVPTGEAAVAFLTEAAAARAAAAFDFAGRPLDGRPLRARPLPPLLWDEVSGEWVPADA